MITLVCFAPKEEAAPFRKIAAGKPGMSILLTGIGRKNAEKSVREFLATNSLELVLTCGFTGGLNPDLALGAVVFDTSFPSSSRRESAQIENGEKSEPNHVGWHKIKEKHLGAGAEPRRVFCAA